MRIRHDAFAAALAAAALLAPPLAAAQSRVAIEPVTAELDRNWVYDLKEYRAKANAVSESDARRMADDYAKSLQAELEKALRAQGFEVVPPASGVVRLSARIDNLFVNAPDTHAAGVRNLSRDAGHATLRAEARDGAGAVVMKSENRADAGDTGGPLKHASDVSNRFWFDALFRDWSEDVAKELKQKAR